MLRDTGYRTRRDVLPRKSLASLLFSIYECWLTPIPGARRTVFGRTRDLALRCPGLREMGDEAILRAKAGPDEAVYLRLTQENARLPSRLLSGQGEQACPPQAFRRRATSLKQLKDSRDGDRIG